VISYDTTEMARQAAELLFDRLAGERTKPMRRTIPTKLVVRDT